MKSKIFVVFYSMYGHIFQMAEAIKEGANSVEGVEVTLFQVPELVPESVLQKSGALETRKKFSHIPIIQVNQLPEADTIIFGTPTRYGNMCAQMRNFLDQTGGLWVGNKLVGKLASVFTSTGTQHGGQETTITSFHTTLFHLGFVVTGVPYAEPALVNMDEITGGSPYGASTMAGSDNKRQISANELKIAVFQGKYVAELTKALKAGREMLKNNDQN